MHENLSCPFVSFVIHNAPKRPVQQRLEQMLSRVDAQPGIHVRDGKARRAVSR